MPKYQFASVRGDDLEIEEDNPIDAYIALCEREKFEGTLWGLMDQTRNRHAVRKQGFKWLNANKGVCYKEIY